MCWTFQGSRLLAKFYLRWIKSDLTLNWVLVIFQEQIFIVQIYTWINGNWPHVSECMQRSSITLARDNIWSTLSVSENTSVVHISCLLLLKVGDERRWGLFICCYLFCWRQGMFNASFPNFTVMMTKKKKKIKENIV